MAGNVNLIDPNSVNINTSVVNGIPQYQDLYIFAELTASRRARTVLTTTSNGTVHNTSTDNSITVNFMGNNQNINSPNYLKFTTDWYDGSSGDNIQYEGFGISNIKVIINSSFIPQVNIDFIDVRGLAFFNQPNSPYRILFDFPPPIFNLTLKGYYGKALSYQLHLVKYTSEFKAENGNFVISAQFVANTFAPLTDILFRYAVNFALIQDPSSITSNVGLEPNNTFDLITKLNSLYSQTSSKLNTTADSQAYDTILNQINQLNSAISLLGNFKQDQNLIRYCVPYLVVVNKSFRTGEDNGDELTILKTLSDYDDYIKNLANDSTLNTTTQKLYIISLVGVSSSYITDGIPYITDVFTNYRAGLITQAQNLVGTGTNGISNTDIPAPETLTSNQSINTTNLNVINTDILNYYVGIDVTNYYSKLYKVKSNAQDAKLSTMTNLREKINNMVIDNLGMKPTIYNIFRIILHDVDTFFDILRKTSVDAETHHNSVDNKSKIATPDFKDISTNDNETIYAFPLVVKQKTVCNQNTEIRIAPIDLSNGLTQPFPEIVLINNFIETFKKEQQITELYKMKSAQNADGSYKWIPVSPIDSLLGSTTTTSPYIGIDPPDGGSTSHPIVSSNDPKIIQIFKILIQRYYILSQYSLSDIFYGNSDQQRAIDLLYQKSEAINLVSSITNKSTLSQLSTLAGRYKSNADLFYTEFLQKNLFNYYSFPKNSITSFKLSNNGDDIYVNRNNPNFKGVELNTAVLTSQINNGVDTSNTQDTNNLVAEFQKSVATNGFKEFFKGTVTLGHFDFTQENVLHIKDNGNDNNTFETRFIGNLAIISNAITKIGFGDDTTLEKVFGVLATSPFKTIKKFNPTNKIDFIKNTVTNNNGNQEFIIENASSTYMSSAFESFGNIANIWSDQLTNCDNDIHSVVIDNTNVNFDYQLSALMILSNFGFTLSPFNMYPSGLNNLIFTTPAAPAAIEVPNFLPLYIGALVGITPNSADYTKIYNFFINGAGKTLRSSGVFIFADIIDINNLLSAKDKALFKNLYNSFYGKNGEGTVFRRILGQLQNVYNEANSANVVKRDVYVKAFNEIGGILNQLITRTNIINFSQITFKKTPDSNSNYNIHDNVGYTSILDINNNNIYDKSINDNYFKGLFQEMYHQITQINNKAIKDDQENKKLTGDEDIITQLYYSFKNINDKWLVSPTNGIKGYPFNKPSGRLIDSFVFVDRAMNPIGDTIINPKLLTDVLDDPNASIFTVLTQLLSINGFEFFPLQNFMNFSDDEWTKSFNIDTSGSVNNSPVFVCMYIGGSSSYPTGMEQFSNQFKDDGIIDIDNPGVSDFNTFSATTSTNGTVISNGCYPVPTDDGQVVGNPNFPYRQVRAFRVKFGTQNQSMFNNIKIDSKEYPETNESIQILSRLAGDNKLQAPTPKGQNLYNLYENRSYKATVTGFGNVMIQPTQYFQIENIPLYNGAYITLSVEHNIEPNKMTTSFSGTKILKYPIPRVLESSAIIGFDGGNTDDTSNTVSSTNAITLGTGTAGNPAQAQFNSMYNFKIQ